MTTFAINNLKVPRRALSVAQKHFLKFDRSFPINGLSELRGFVVGAQSLDYLTEDCYLLLGSLRRRARVQQQDVSGPRLFCGLFSRFQLFPKPDNNSQ